MATNLKEALKYGVAPWTEINSKFKSYWIFEDSTSPAKGYLCFVPIEDTDESIFSAYRAAFKHGTKGVKLNIWPAFNVILSVGFKSNLTTPYPHVHLIPRY